MLAVGSKNPVKLLAALNGAKKALKNDSLNMEGFNSSSGVSNQPFGDKETKLGAINRARSAYNEYFSLHDEPPLYSLGLEGGVEFTEDETLECFAWIAVYNGTDNIGLAKTASFALPSKVKELVKNGMELGDADDIVFGSSNSKQSGGAVGLLTRNVIDRCIYYEHAVILAFIPFHWPDLYI